MQPNQIQKREALDFLRSIPDKYCDIFTDPPYNVGKDYGDMVDDNRSDYVEWITEVLTECIRVSNVLTVYVPKKWNRLYWNVLGDDFQEIILPFRPRGAIRHGFSNQFNKLLTNAKPPNGKVVNVWDNMPQPGLGVFFRENTYGHPGYTSEAITNRAIRELCSSDIICDPFMGTGTTAVCAIKNGKKYIGCELNDFFIDLATNRIQESTYKIDYF